MLTLPEKVIFILSLIISIYLASRVVQRITRTLRRGQGKPDWNVIKNRLVGTLARVAAMQPTFQIRLGPSILHAFIAWAFIFYVLVNLGDIVEGFFASFELFGSGNLRNFYNLAADVLSVLALIGMVALLIRRFALKTPALRTRADVFLNPVARRSILRDSAIVGSFILVHVGSRFLGQSL